MPDPEKVSAVVSWPPPLPPKSSKPYWAWRATIDVLSPGLLSARPLTILLVGIPNDKHLASCSLSWSVEAQTAFDNLKKTLTEALVLAYADFSESFLLYTDASHHGLGAVLSQVQKGK